MLHPDWIWYHCTTHTYGAWLHGDPRGFRTRHHREHIEGDYKNPPPPGTYDGKLERSERLMKQPPVVIPVGFRKVIGHAIIEKLIDRLGAELIALSVSGQHVHLLAKMPGGDIPREWIGKAKKNATHAMTERGWQGNLWAKRSRALPCRGRAHQVNVFKYILRHAEEGAWVWSFRDPK